MTADVIKGVSCFYIQEVVKWINNLRFGTECYNIDLLRKLETDLFIAQSGCVENYCYDYQADEKPCNNINTCNIVIESVDIPKSCQSITLTNF